MTDSLRLPLMGTETNCIIVHGSPPDKQSWVPIGARKRWNTWIKEELEQRGIPTFVPNMPVPWQPVYNDWKQEFEKLPVNDHSIFVGHSAGAAFLVRWLGGGVQRIHKLILVAPGKTIGSYPNAEHNKELYDFEINPHIKERVGSIIIFTSPEEPLHRKENVALYKELLGATVVSLPGKGHFRYEDMGTDAFPELLDEILK